MRIWGITGTNGKTTTTWITAAFLDGEGRKCGYVTTVEVFDGKDRYYTGYTTPPLVQLKEIFAKMEANGCTDCVMEMSSHAIHQRRAGDTVFAGGAFTNLSEDHLDYHKTMEEYFRVKRSFAEQIAHDRWGDEPPPPALGRRDFPPYVVCLDGGYGREMFNAVGNLPLNVIPVSIGKKSGQSTADSGCDPNGDSLSMPNNVDRASSPCVQEDISFQLSGRGRPDHGQVKHKFTVFRFDLSQLRLVGDYNKSNVLVAAALAEAAGVSHESIQAKIPTLEPRWGRLEYVPCAAKAKVYVDFAHTPDGLEKVLGAVRTELHRQPSFHRFPNLSQGGDALATCQTSNLQPRLWVVFGAGGDRDPMKRPLMGAACAKLADRLVVTSDNPRSEDPLKIIEAILGGIGEDRRAATVVEPDRKKAIDRALTEAAEGDVVIIAGKGHETTQEIAGVKHPFDDRQVVREWKAKRS